MNPIMRTLCSTALSTGIGIASGTAYFVLSRSVFRTIDQIFGDIICTALQNHHANLKNRSFSQIVLVLQVPFVEEMVFRVTTEPFTFYCFSKLGIPNPKLAASFATAFSFGMIHYPLMEKRVFAIQFPYAILSHLQYSFLHRHFGFAAALSSHVANNFFSYHFPYTNTNYRK